MDAKSTQTSRLGASCGRLGHTAFVKDTDSPLQKGPEALTIVCPDSFMAKKLYVEAAAKSFVFGTTVV